MVQCIKCLVQVRSNKAKRFKLVDSGLFIRNATMTQLSDDDIEEYSDSVTCFIRTCIEEVIPTKTISIYPNQKPWINSDVRSALSARTSAFKSGNTDDRKQASYDLRRSIKQPNDNIKTKLKNNSTTITQEACGRASTTSQVLKGINQPL